MMTIELLKKDNTSKLIMTGVRSYKQDLNCYVVFNDDGSITSLPMMHYSQLNILKEKEEVGI